MEVDLDKLRQDHLQAYTLIRKVGEIGLRKDCKKGITSKTLSEWQHIIETAINGERQALGMRHLDLNVAIDEITKAGYTVTDNSEEK